jgi:hypothetical protein
LTLAMLLPTTSSPVVKDFSALTPLFIVLMSDIVFLFYY